MKCLKNKNLKLLNISNKLNVFLRNVENVGKSNFYD